MKIDLNQYIDHTLLSAQATNLEIENLCLDAIKHRFYAVCINSSRVKDAKQILDGSGVKLVATIGFPLGASSTASKIMEAETATSDGADEIDMVMNIGLFKDRQLELVQDEIMSIKNVIGDKILKVIIETCYLSNDQISEASKLVMSAGADFIKTSTGFGSRGASLTDVKIMMDAVDGKLMIKASGGIGDAETAMEFIKLKVNRIGTSSGIKIVSE